MFLCLDNYFVFPYNQQTDGGQAQQCADLQEDEVHTISGGRVACLRILTLVRFLIIVGDLVEVLAFRLYGDLTATDKGMDKALDIRTGLGEGVLTGLHILKGVSPAILIRQNDGILLAVLVADSTSAARFFS